MHFRSGHLIEIAERSLSADEPDRGTMAGNGGKMAEVEKQAGNPGRRSTARSNREQRPRKKPSARAKKVPAGKVRTANAKAKAKLSDAAEANVKGADELRRSVNREVAAEAERIAKELTLKAAKGDVSSAKLLWNMMTEKKQTPHVSSYHFSESIGTLESEQEWAEPETNNATQTEGSNA